MHGQPYCLNMPVTEIMSTKLPCTLIRCIIGGARLVEHLRSLAVEIDELPGQITSRTTALASSLLAIPGCGPLIAAKLIVKIKTARGERFHSKDAFASGGVEAGVDGDAAAAPILSLLTELDKRTGYLDCFTHAGGKQSRTPELKRNLTAVLLAYSTSLGLTRVAEAWPDLLRHPGLDIGMVCAGGDAAGGEPDDHRLPPTPAADPDLRGRHPVLQ